MNRNRENQRCPKTNCRGKIVEKEVYHDVSPFDAYNETTYSISVCNNNDCGIGKVALEELGEHDWGLDQKKQEFQQKLIAGYKRSARNKALKKEDKIWEGSIEDGID